MKQVLHIFKKDVRHFWPQIALSLAILAGYARFATTEWYPAANWRELWLRAYLPITVLLVPVGWLALLGRSILDERLVGDRQFWITRPYEWKKLLSAKVLFALLFIILPLFVVQLSLLGLAGFAPFRYVPGVLWNDAGLIAVFVLPVAAFATVTASLGQLLLMVVATVLYVIAVAVWIQPSASSLAGDLGDWLTGMLVVIAVVIAVLWQYSGRRTARSRWLLAACAAALPLVLWSLPYETLVAHRFPRLASGVAAPVQLTLGISEPSSDGAPDDEKQEEVVIEFPINTLPLSQELAFALRGNRVSLETPGGIHWSSGWQPDFRLVEPVPWGFYTRVTMKRSVFDKMKASSVKVRIDYALAVFHYGTRHEVQVRTSDFAVPELGICRLFGNVANGFQCRAPLGHSPFLVVLDNAASTCAPRIKGQALSGEAHDWDQGAESSGFSPVDAFAVRFSDVRRVSGLSEPKDENPRMCSGTPVTFTQLVPFQQLSTTVEAEGIRLEDYRSSSTSHFSTSWGWYLR